MIPMALPLKTLVLELSTSILCAGAHACIITHFLGDLLGNQFDNGIGTCYVKELIHFGEHSL